MRRSFTHFITVACAALLLEAASALMLHQAIVYAA